MMKGWKTWLAAAGFAAVGVVQILSGDSVEGIQRLLEGLALIGLGHKLDKAV